MPTALWQWLSSVAPLPVKEFYRAALEFYVTPWFWVALAGVLAAERVWPVTPRSRAVPGAFVEDAVWLNIELAVRALLIPFLGGVLYLIWERTTGAFSIPLLAGFPGLAKIGISLVIWDFLEYGHHWVRHRIRPLWYFHSIHHSQRDLNPFTAGRSHVFEYLIIQPLLFFPMFALQLTPFEIMGTGASIGWFARLSHSNVRTNFGPLGLLFVSPQHHRIHHSIEPAHRDKHFGLLLTVWDRLFGTFWPDRSVYPATGVSEVDFPLPETMNPLAVLGTVARELIYPFQRIAREVRLPGRPAAGMTDQAPD